MHTRHVRQTYTVSLSLNHELSKIKSAANYFCERWYAQHKSYKPELNERAYCPTAAEQRYLGGCRAINVFIDRDAPNVGVRDYVSRKLITKFGDNVLITEA